MALQLVSSLKVARWCPGWLSGCHTGFWNLERTDPHIFLHHLMEAWVVLQWCLRDPSKFQPGPTGSASVFFFFRPDNGNDTKSGNSKCSEPKKEGSVSIPHLWLDAHNQSEPKPRRTPLTSTLCRIRFHRLVLLLADYQKRGETMTVKPLPQGTEENGIEVPEGKVLKALAVQSGKFYNHLFHHCFPPVS